MSESKKQSQDNPPYIEISGDDSVVINFFDPVTSKYTRRKTTLSKKDAESLTNEEIDEIAKHLLTDQYKKIKKKYAIGDVVIANKATYPISGKSSVKQLEVGIYASETDDNRLLHYLLTKTEQIED